VVGQDLHEKILVLWQQKLVDKSGWQCCESIIGRCEHCERAFALKGLNKTGLGTLYLNGQNSYLGGTVIEAGTLRGVGSVAGLMTVRNGAEFAVGQEAAFGVFEVGALTLEAGSRTSLLISGTTAGTDYDQIASAGGALSYGGTLDLTLSGS
jgi:autotransporter-associated beta strand protein